MSFFFLLRTTTALAAIVSRIAEISTIYGGRTPIIPQAFYDKVEVESADSNNHPHIGPYSHVAVKNGNWSDPTTWDVNTVPGVGSIVNCGGYTITYDVESDDKVKDIHVSGNGTFKFATHLDTRLWIDTLFCHGTFIMGTGTDPILDSATQAKPRAEIVFHQTEAPGVTTRLGLITMGPVRIQGQRKTPRVFSDSPMLAGATTITLPIGGANWKVGDELLFAATENAGTSATDATYTGPTSFWGPRQNVMGNRTRTLGYHLSQDEVRTITAINGNVVTINAALTYNHQVYSRTLKHGQVVTIKPVVCNLSRSIRLRSEDPSTLQKRAHAMFMHHPDVDIRHAEFLDMGRTDTDPSLVIPDGTLVYAEEAATTLLTNSNNVRGRYPVHFHGTGAYFGRGMAIADGLSVRASASAPPIPGWAITHHNSRAAIENCIVYKVRGSGIVSELGNEIGQWIGNHVAWVRGDGFELTWGTRAEVWQNHNGHAGVAYENQARQVLQQGNTASSCHFAWMFFQQNVDQLNRVPDRYSLRLYDFMTQGGNIDSPADPTNIFNQDGPTYGIEQAQIPDFHDNVAYGCGAGFAVAHRQFTERTDTTPMISRGFHCIKTKTPFLLINYSFFYSFYDFVWIGTGGTDQAAQLGPVSWQFNFVNGHIEDYDWGFVNNGLGFNVNGWWIDLQFVNVTHHFEDFTANFDLAAHNALYPGKVWPNDHWSYNMMGPMTQTGGDGVNTWQGILREWKNLDSATDLPQPYPVEPVGVTSVEPSPGTPKPYFVLDPACDTVLTNTALSVELWGTIVDSVGCRYWPTWFSSETFSPTYPGDFPGKSTRRNLNATATDLVLRNGCFLDGGTWKTRCWFVDHDRFTGEYLQFYVDLTLPAMDAGLLAANTVVPVKPVLPLLPEEIGTLASPLLIDTTPPTIVSASTASVDEGVTLAHVLKAAGIHVSWAITGGADAGDFEINTSGGVATLRWTGNGTQSYTSPADADANNLYEVQVTATNPLGYSSTQTITVTVKEANLRLWLDFSDTSTITHVAGAVSQVNDKSGNGYHHTQAAANKPVTGTRTINGLNALDFQGNQWLEAPAGFRDISQGANTLYIVFKADSATAAMRPVNGSIAGNTKVQLALATGAYTVLHVSSGSAVSTSITRDTNTHIFGWRRNGVNIRGFRDGVLGTAGTNAQNPGTLNALGIGRDPVNTFNGFDGIIAEVKWYGVEHTDSQANAIGTALAAKWGTTWTPI